MSEVNHIDTEANRVTETLEGEGTTHTPIVEYLRENEEIHKILTANGKSIAKGSKGNNLYSYASTGEPTYVFTDSRILALMPQGDSDEIHDIAYSTVASVENHFGWTKNRMEIHTKDGTEYHLWLKPSDEKEQKGLETFISEKIDVEKESEKKSEDGSVVENKTDSDSENSRKGPANGVDARYSFTAKKKGIKVQDGDKKTHHTSEKGSKSKFEFTDSEFIASIPKESGEERILVDYNSISDISFSSSLRKNRMDIEAGQKTLTFWTKDSLDQDELLEFITEQGNVDRYTIEESLGPEEVVEHEFSSEKKGIKEIGEAGTTHYKPEREKAKFAFTNKRFLAVIPQEMDDQRLSVDYESIIDVGFSSGMAINRIDLYTKSDDYKFWLQEDITEKTITKFIYNRIRGNKSNKLAEELGGSETIRIITSSSKYGIKVRGKHTKPEGSDAKFVFTNNRLLAFVPQQKSDKLVKIDYSSIVDFESASGMTKNRIDLHKGTTIYTFWMTGKPSKIIDFLSRNAGRERFVLINDDDDKGVLRIEGWTDGSSEINAEVDASSQSKGSAFGVEGGPFFAAKTSSKSSIDGDISGEISDNTYTSEIELLKIYKQNLTLKSGVELDIHLSDIDNIFKQDGGMVIEVSSTTFRIGDLPKDAKVSEAVDYVKDQIKASTEQIEQSESKSTEVDETDSEDDNTADKLRELKDLQEEGILTDEEFESKKQDLLNDF